MASNAFHLNFLKRILSATTCDEHIPENQIGEGKKYQWRRTHDHNSPVLINTETGEAVHDYIDEKSEPFQSAFSKRLKNVGLSYEKYKDVEQAVYTLNMHKGIKLQGFEKLKQYEWKHVSTMFDAIRMVHHDFPSIDLNIEYVGSDSLPPKAVMAMSSQVLPDNIEKLLGNTGAQRLASNEKCLQREKTLNPKRGFHPPNQTLASTTFHEFGHAVISQIIKQCYDDAVNSSFAKHPTKEVAEQYRSKLMAIKYKMCDMICEEAFGVKINDERFVEKQGEISEYAKKSSSETISEAFADIYDNGEFAHENSQRIYSLVKNFYAQLTTSETAKRDLIKTLKERK